MSADGEALEQLLALERETSPEARAAYLEALRNLAERLRGPFAQATQAMFANWLLAELDLADGPGPSGHEWREVLWDAVADIAADASALAAFLETAAARLAERPKAQANLLSMLRVKAVWRARDKLRRRHAWANRIGALPVEPGQDLRSRWIAGLVVQRVVSRYGDEPGVLDALSAIMSGATVSEASRVSGLSRQAIYRWLARIRGWVEGTA